MPPEPLTSAAAERATAEPSLDVLEDLLSFYVRSVNYALSNDLDRRLEGLEVARGTGKITTLLMIDREPGVRPSAIAHATLRDRPSISRVVAPMVEAGLVERTTDESERRAQKLRITARGHEVAERVRAVVRDQNEAFFACLSEEDRRHLLRILRDLYLQIRNGDRP